MGLAEYFQGQTGHVQGQTGNAQGQTGHVQGHTEHAQGPVQRPTRLEVPVIDLERKESNKNQKSPKPSFDVFVEIGKRKDEKVARDFKLVTLL